MAAYVVRTDTNGQALLDKFRAGSARIGWSYSDDLDLKYILNEEWDNLNGEQQAAWYCHGFVDVAAKGDLLFYPNVPEYGQFCVVKLTDDEYMLLSEEDGIEGDFRSSRRCELIIESLDKGDAIVPPAIKHKLGLQRRFYELRVAQSDIDTLIRNLPKRSIGRATYPTAFLHMMDEAYSSLAQQWTRFFPVQDLSKGLAELLKAHGERVDLREGPSERGTDLVVEIQNDFLDRPIVIGIQAGSYEGDVNAETARRKLDQLLSGWKANSLDYGALVLAGNWTDPAKKVVEDHNLANPTQRIKSIDGRQLVKILTRTSWIEEI